MIKLQSSRTFNAIYSPWMTEFICPKCGETNQFMNASRASCVNCNIPVPYMEQIMTNIKQRWFYHTGKLTNSIHF